MVELFINGQQVDVEAGETMSLNYAFDDINNLDAGANNYSKSIALPATDRTRRFFRFADDPSVTDFFGQKTDLKAEIRVGGLVVFSGIVNLLSVQRNAAT